MMTLFMTSQKLDYYKQGINRFPFAKLSVLKSNQPFKFDRTNFADRGLSFFKSIFCEKANVKYPTL